MTDNYPNFDALKSSCREGQDYRIRLEDHGGRLLVFSPHAGGIEPGVSELVRAVAGTDLSYYLFEGIRSANNAGLHLTSHHFDEPRCLELIAKFETSLAVHGCNSEKSIVYVGGTNQSLREKLSLRLAGMFEVRPPQGTGLEGLAPMNICNRTASGSGVQLEFSSAIRRGLFDNLERESGRLVKSPAFLDLVAVIREVILSSF